MMSSSVAGADLVITVQTWAKTDLQIRHELSVTKQLQLSEFRKKKTLGIAVDTVANNFMLCT